MLEARKRVYEAALAACEAEAARWRTQMLVDAAQVIELRLRTLDMDAGSFPVTATFRYELTKECLGMLVEHYD